MSTYTLNAAKLRYLNQMMTCVCVCVIGTWLNVIIAINFSKNLRKMRLTKFKFTVLLLFSCNLIVLEVSYSSCRLRSIRRLSYFFVIVISCIVPVKLGLIYMTGLITNPWAG